MTRYTTDYVQSMQTVLARLDHTVFVFEQLTRDLRREEREELFAIQMRIEALHALMAALQQQVQTAVFEHSKQRCRRKPLLRDRVAAHVVVPMAAYVG